MADEAQQEGAHELLWTPKHPEQTQMHMFLKQVETNYGQSFATYDDLYKWSVDQTADFWQEVWEFTGVRASQGFDQVISSTTQMFPRPTFFHGARLNFAENLLFPTCNPDPSSTAIIAATETTRTSVTWAQLRARVGACQAGMRALGLAPGDRVAGYVAHHVDAVVIMLAATSLGALWTGISPDSGVSMVLDRLQQIAPALLFADAAQEYNGKTHNVLPKVVEVARALPSLKAVVVLPALPADADAAALTPAQGRLLGFAEFCQGDGQELAFEQLEADHPVYILYSSGTTGAPKCICHGAIGTLLQHKKEHMLHCDIRPGQRLFYFTTVTWMMWHWLIGGLAVGATLVLYDGSPMRYRSVQGVSEPDDLAMPRLIDELRIDHFGTSAKYLSILEQKALFPRAAPHNLSLATLKAVYNTASPLAPSTFRYVYKAFGSDLMLASITGGTDIISLFGAGCPIAPVYAGEVQIAGLGMAIRAFADDSTDITATGRAGDLVCVKPFICQPVLFWPPGAAGEARYRKSYFERFRVANEPIWHHGDFIQFHAHATGAGLMMLGRSDGVLNPAGIRFGSAEIYNILLRHFPARVSDALCIGRRRAGEADETVVLFVKMEPGVPFGAALAKEIQTVVRAELSARHVPPVVDECPDIPVTVNGKKIESAVKQIISGSTIQPSASVANAECLDFYRQWASTH